jgi:hypothetical protein
LSTGISTESVDILVQNTTPANSITLANGVHSPLHLAEQRIEHLGEARHAARQREVDGST